MSTSVGTIIHNVPIKPSDLPEHAGLNESAHPETNPRPPLVQFIKDTLIEGDSFANTITWSGSDKAKPSAPSTARVEIGKRTVNLSSGPEAVAFDQSIIPSRKSYPPKGSEYWYGRKSQHENAEKVGTASFAELDAGLRQDHSPKEAEYTPDVYDCVTVLDYAEQLANTEFGGTVLQPDLKVYEMAHNLGALLTPRVFAIAIVSGQLNQGERFVVVQLPIDLSGFGKAMYSNGRNVKEGDSKIKKRRCIQGYYASIERGVNLGEKTEWTMITSSDAGGNLPRWLQNTVAPGKVVHDVGLFMKWNHSNRDPSGNRGA